ncbi:MAG: helix-turn-helix domain-containing protein [Solirubrobacteraceae bacterium]
MANERLRAAIAQAGIDNDQLATQLDVDSKTVERWLAGRTPYARHRTRVARILGCDEDQLWPEAASPAVRDDARREIAGVWVHGDDLGAPDWRTLLRQASERVELLGCSLIEIVSATGVIDALGAKARAGCEIRILTAAPDSFWIAATAHELGQDQEDDTGITALGRETERVRGHLEPLLDRPNVGLRRFYTDRFNTILRFDEQMLVSLHLWGATAARSPLLHLRRREDDGLFDQFAEHFEAVWQNASQPAQPNPDMYPPPGENPDRYAPFTDTSAKTEPPDA